MSAYHPALLLLTSLTCLGLASNAQGRSSIAQTDADTKSIAPVQAIDAIDARMAQTPYFQSDRDSFGNGGIDPSSLLLNGEDLQAIARQQRFPPVGKSDRPIPESVHATPETAATPLQNVVVATDTDRPVQIAQEVQNEKKPADRSPNRATGKKGFSRKDLFWLLLLALGTLTFAGIFAGAFYLLTRSGGEGEELESQETPENASGFPEPPDVVPATQPLAHSDSPGSPLPPTHQGNGYTEPRFQVSQKIKPAQDIPPLAKIDAIEKAIEELQNRTPSQRRKAIWELGQNGDSRAIQPLVNLLIDSDSKQRSLILAALAEIGNRTLQPMNRALILSLQDSNPEVRKNAIRDLTRIYDLLSQTSQLLRHAVEDADPEVRESAKWALSQLNRIRTGSNSEPRTPLQNWSSSPENYPEDIP